MTYRLADNTAISRVFGAAGEDEPTAGTFSGAAEDNDERKAKDENMVFNFLAFSILGTAPVVGDAQP